MKASMKNLKEELFVHQHIEHIDYEEFLEEHEFTKEKYMQVYEKIWASLRHDVWKECKRYCKIDRVSKVSSARFKQIYEDVHKTFETVRADVYEKVMDTVLDEKNLAREIMQKAYITYSTISHIKNEDGSVVRQRWADQVSKCSQTHSQYTEEMEKGVFPDGIDKDPRMSALPDAKYSLKSIPGYVNLSKQKTMKHEGLEEKPIPTHVLPYIEKVRQRLYDARARIAERKKKNGEDEEEDDDDETEEDDTPKQRKSLVNRQSTGGIKDLKPPSDDDEKADDVKAE